MCKKYLTLQCSHHSWLEVAIHTMEWSRYPFKLNVFPSLLPSLLDSAAPGQFRVHLYTEVKTLINT